MKHKHGAKHKNSHTIPNEFKDLQKKATDLKYYLQKKSKQTSKQYENWTVILL